MSDDEPKEPKDSGQSQMWPEPHRASEGSQAVGEKSEKKWKTKLLKNQRNVKVFKVNFSDGSDSDSDADSWQRQVKVEAVQIKGHENSL